MQTPIEKARHVVTHPEIFGRIPAVLAINWERLKKARGQTVDYDRVGPPPLIGMIEARGLGLLAARSIANTEIRLIVDLDRVETERLPERRHRIVLGVAIDLVFHGTSRHFPYGLIQYARHGRVE